MTRPTRGLQSAATNLTRNLLSGCMAGCLALSALVAAPSVASASPGDYDGDGLADLSVALASKNSSTNTGATAWLTRGSSNAASLFWTWNIPADAYVSGRFFVGDAKYYPGIVWVRSSSLPLEWYIKNSSNQDVALKFGLPGDAITNLADWDGDGRDDISVVRVGTGDRLFWYVALTASAEVKQFEWGVKGDKPGLSDVDGDGIAELVVLRPGTYNWYIRKIDGSTPFDVNQWGLNDDIPLLPTDLDGDHLPDFIIARRDGDAQTAYVKYGNGSSTTIPLGFSTSIPQVGNFTGTPGFAWSQRDTGWTAIRNADASLNILRFGIAQNAIVRADGTVVQPSESGQFPTSTSTGGGGSSGGGSTGTVASCTQTFSSGWLLKPAAQDTGGTRLGKPLILYSRNYPRSSCLNVLASNGTIIGKYGKFSANRFYSGYGCGSMLTGSQFAQRALDAAGSKNIYVQDPSTGYCAGPGPADGRTDHR